MSDALDLVKRKWDELQAACVAANMPLEIRLFDGEADQDKVGVVPFVTREDGFGVFIMSCEETKPGDTIITIDLKTMQRILPGITDAYCLAMAQRLRAQSIRNGEMPVQLPKDDE
jgi:hypothetical protein